MRKRAWKDSISFFGWNIRTFTVPLFLWVLGAFFYYKWQGKEAVLEEIAVAISFALIPVAIFLVFLYLFHLIRAPVYIKFEREKEPHLAIDGTSVSNYGVGLGHSWRLKVKNIGTHEAENCRGQLIALADLVYQKSSGLDNWPKHEYLEWVTNRGESIPIPGSTTAELEIANYDRFHQPLQLAYAKGQEFREQYAIKIVLDGIVLVISITSKNRAPIYATCVLDEYSNTDENLRILEVTDKCPDISSYQKSNPHKEDSQTE